MKKLLGLALALCLLAACTPAAEEPTPSAAPTAEPAATTEPTASPEPLPPPLLDAPDYPRVDGSTATVPLAAALLSRACAIPLEEAALYVDHSQTSEAYISLLYNQADLILAYEPSAGVLETIQSEGVELLMAPIGSDALVFLANESNPVQSLGSLQLVDIYSGNTDNWSAVGGPDAPIVAFQRDPSSGSQVLMQKLCMKDIPMAEAPTELMPSEMGFLIESIAQYSNEGTALGYSVYYYAQNMYARPGVKILSVDGIAPSNETIASGRYPYVNDFYAVIRADAPADSSQRLLYDFLTSNEGKAVVESAGYVAKP